MSLVLGEIRLPSKVLTLDQLEEGKQQAVEEMKPLSFILIDEIIENKDDEKVLKGMLRTFPKFSVTFAFRKGTDDFKRLPKGARQLIEWRRKADGGMGAAIVSADGQEALKFIEFWKLRWKGKETYSKLRSSLKKVNVLGKGFGGDEENEKKLKHAIELEDGAADQIVEWKNKQGWSIRARLVEVNLTEYRILPEGAEQKEQAHLVNELAWSSREKLKELVVGDPWER